MPRCRLGRSDVIACPSDVTLTSRWLADELTVLGEKEAVGVAAAAAVRELDTLAQRGAVGVALLGPAACTGVTRQRADLCSRDSGVGTA